MLGITVVWDKMVSRDRTINSKQNVDFPFNSNKLITFDGDFIIVNRRNETKVFSARCTHLGCKIDQFEGDKLLCPCHGSVFNLDGKVTKGPAVLPLKEIDFEIDNKLKRIKILV